MPKISVEWGTIHYRGDAQTVYNEICSIGNDVSPGEIVEYAKAHKDSELYKCFTWDDSVAAEKYRMHEARLIVVNLVTKVETRETGQEESLRVLIKTDSCSGYKRIQDVVKNADEYQKAIAMAKRELDSFRRKYRQYSELEEVIFAIEQFIN